MVMETLLEIARIVTDKAYSRKSIEAVIADDAEGVLSAFLRGLIDGTDLPPIELTAGVLRKCQICWQGDTHRKHNKSRSSLRR